MGDSNETPGTTALPGGSEQSPGVSGGGTTDWQARFNGLMASFNQRGAENERLKAELEKEKATHLETKGRLGALEAEKIRLLQEHTGTLDTLQKDRNTAQLRLAEREAELKTVRAIQGAKLSDKFAALIRATADEAELQRQIEAARQAQEDAMETARQQLGKQYVPASQGSRTPPPGLSAQEIQVYLDGAGEDLEERRRRRQEVIARLQNTQTTG